MAPGMVSMQSEESLEMGSGRSRLSLEKWSAMSNLRPVRTSGSKCKKVKEMSRVKTLSLEASFSGEVEEGGCETPKSTENRIPHVDVDFCPPAPKKARGMGRRLALTCAVESENSSNRQDLGLSRSYLF